MEIQTSAWSETAASNNTSPPDGFPEGMAYSAVNDGIREQMAAIKRAWNRDHAVVTSGGTSTAYTIALTVSPPAWVQGLRFGWRANADCGAAPTLAPGTLAAKSLNKPTAAGLSTLAAADIRAGQMVFCSYDTTADALIVENAIAATLASPPYLLEEGTTLSGSSVQITGIPSTAKALVVSIDGIATSGTGTPALRIGPSGGVVTSGYLGGVSSVVNGITPVASVLAGGISLAGGWSSAVVATGTVRFTRHLASSNIWIAEGTLGRHDGAFPSTLHVAGRIALSDALERVQILTADAFTAGTITVFYS